MLIALLAGALAVSIYAAASPLIDPRNTCGRLVLSYAVLVAIVMFLFDGFSAGQHAQIDRFFFSSVGLLGMGTSIRGIRLKLFDWAVLAAIFGSGFALAGIFDFAGQAKMANAAYAISTALTLVLFFAYAAIGHRARHPRK